MSVNEANENPDRMGATVRFRDASTLGTLQQFSDFHHSTYSFNLRESKALRGAKSHFEKSQTLMRLARKLEPNLDIDEAELAKDGYTPATNADELCTVIEAAIMELYASVDCTRQVLVACFPKARGMPSDSTRKFFTKIQNGDEFGQPFPPPLTGVIKTAILYSELLHLRDELTHSDTGNVSRDKGSSLTNYMHAGMRQQGNALVINDIFAWVSEKTDQLNRFLGQIFHHLNSTLSNERGDQLCGFVDGRVLMRQVNYKEAMSKRGGACISFSWFELPENPTCPFANECHIYLARLGNKTA